MIIYVIIVLIMRVLEVGPGRYPVEKYLGNPEVDYVATESGVWDKDIAKYFDLAASRLRPGDDSRRLLHIPVSSLVGNGYDIGVAANVYGDPGSIPRDSSGRLSYTGGAEKIMSEALARRILPNGELEIFETYTPMNMELLVEILGNAGFGLREVVGYGKELGYILEEYYLRQAPTMMLRMVPEVRINAARSHDLPIEEPYFARFIRE